MAERMNVTQTLEQLRQERGFAPELEDLVAQRRRFAEQHMAGVPAEYADTLGVDPARWPAEAAALSREHRIASGTATPAELMQAGLENPALRLPPQNAEAGKAPSPLDLIRQGLTGKVA